MKLDELFVAAPVVEALNHMGEKEYRTWDGWKRAAKQANPAVWFEGDKDIAQAMVGAKPYKQGKTYAIGEWDGEVGSIFNDLEERAKAITEARHDKMSTISAALHYHELKSVRQFIKDNDLDLDLEETSVEAKFPMGVLPYNIVGTTEELEKFKEQVVDGPYGIRDLADLEIDEHKY